MAPNAISPPPPYDEDQGGQPASTYKGIWKYPTNRDVPFRMAEDWLAGKRKDDNIGTHWRVHDKLYNVEPFMKNHPGGQEWLEMTRGTDITEAFESCHVKNIRLVEQTLAKYFVQDATHPRISPYTLKQDGFFLTLKRKVEPIMKKHGTGPTLVMLLIQDSLALGFMIAAVLGVLWKSMMLGVLSGVFLGLSTICAHNFFHLKENWRKFYFDMSLLNHYEWRITHALSHHLYPNTLMDIELSLFPTYQFLPNRPKSWYQRHLAIFYSHLVYAIGFWLDIGKRFYHVGTGQKGIRKEYFLVIAELLALIIIAEQVTDALKIWVLLHTVSGYVLLSIGATAAHHHPDIFHDGDEPLSDPDFGIGQLDATRDRAENIFNNLFVTAITFGHHPLHHLFPTVCHSKLPLLKGVFEETVREFKLHYPGIPQLELYMGCYQQLARTEIKKRKKTN